MEKEQALYVDGPLGGTRLDAPPIRLQPNMATRVRNKRVTLTEITPIGGLEELGENLPLSSSVLGIRQFVSYGEDFRTLVFTEDDIKVLNLDRNWESILDTEVWNIDEDLPFDTSFMINHLIICARNRTPLKWDGDLLEKAEEIESPMDMQAGCARAFKDRMVYAHTVENGNTIGQRVRWTHIGTFDNFDTGYANFADLVDTAGTIVALEKLGDQLVVYKEDSIILCSWIGGRSVFSFETAVSDIDLAGQRAIANLGDRHLIVGHENIFLYDGGRTLHPIGEPIRREMPGLVDSTLLNRIQCVRIRDEVYIFGPVGGGPLGLAEPVPDRAYVYNTRLEQWYRMDYMATAVGRKRMVETVTIGNLEGTIGEQPGRIGDYGGAEAMSQLVLGQGNMVFVLSDTAKSPDGSWDSKDFTLSEGHMSRFNRIRAVEFEATGEELRLSYSSDGGDAWSKIADVELGEHWDWHRVFLDRSMRRIRLRFSGRNFRLRAFAIHYRVGAPR